MLHNYFSENWSDYVWHLIAYQYKIIVLNYESNELQKYTGLQKIVHNIFNIFISTIKIMFP